MKLGNLQLQGAKSCGIYPRDKLNQSAGSPADFYLERGKKYGKTSFYIGVCNRRTSR